MLALLGGIAGAISLFFGHLGYFGGPVYVDLPATGSTPPALHGTVALLMSGDLGFNIGMGPQVAKRLRADGIPVIGFNSLTAFRRTRTQMQVEALVTDAATHALAFAHADHLILIGQSFGADMLHVGLPAMPAALRAHVRLVALVVPGATVQFRASPSDILTMHIASTDALPTASLIDWSPLLCIHGQKEAGSLCPLLTGGNVRTVVLPGGHALRRDAGAVHDVLIDAIRAAA